MIQNPVQSATIDIFDCVHLVKAQVIQVMQGLVNVLLVAVKEVFLVQAAILEDLNMVEIHMHKQTFM